MLRIKLHVNLLKQNNIKFCGDNLESRKMFREEEIFRPQLMLHGCMGSNFAIFNGR